MQLQIIALTAILATAIALPLPDLMGHFSFKRQVPADITGAVAGSISGITGAVIGGVAGAIGAATGAGASVASVTPLGSLPGLGSLPVGSLPVGGLPI